MNSWPRRQEQPYSMASLKPLTKLCLYQLRYVLVVCVCTCTMLLCMYVCLQQPKASPACPPGKIACVVSGGGLDSRVLCDILERRQDSQMCRRVMRGAGLLLLHMIIPPATCHHSFHEYSISILYYLVSLAIYECPPIHRPPTAKRNETIPSCAQFALPVISQSVSQFSQ